MQVHCVGQQRHGLRAPPHPLQVPGHRHVDRAGDAHDDDAEVDLLHPGPLHQLGDRLVADVDHRAEVYAPGIQQAQLGREFLDAILGDQAQV